MEIIISEQQKNAARIKKISIALSVLALLASFTQPAFYIEGPHPDAWAPSLLLFLTGWTGILGGSYESLIWYANPMYLAAIFCFIKGSKKAIFFSVAAVLVGLSFSLLPSILSDESGKRSKITSLEAGYWLWIISFALLLVGIIAERVIANEKQPAEN
jgi:hypothetical protein